MRNLGIAGGISGFTQGLQSGYQLGSAIKKDRQADNFNAIKKQAGEAYQAAYQDQISQGVPDYEAKANALSMSADIMTKSGYTNEGLALQGHAIKLKEYGQVESQKAAESSIAKGYASDNIPTAQIESKPILGLGGAVAAGVGAGAQVASAPETESGLKKLSGMTPEERMAQKAFSAGQLGLGVKLRGMARDEKREDEKDAMVKQAHEKQMTQADLNIQESKVKLGELEAMAEENKEEDALQRDNRRDHTVGYLYTTKSPDEALKYAKKYYGPNVEFKEIEGHLAVVDPQKSANGESGVVKFIDTDPEKIANDPFIRKVVGTVKSLEQARLNETTRKNSLVALQNDKENIIEQLKDPNIKPKDRAMYRAKLSKIDKKLEALSETSVDESEVLLSLQDELRVVESKLKTAEKSAKTKLLLEKAELEDAIEQLLPENATVQPEQSQTVPAGRVQIGNMSLGLPTQGQQVQSQQALTTPKSGANMPSFATVEEAEKANLPKGSVVLVGGRKAIVD